MTVTQTCPSCSAPMPVDAPSGLCPGCLLRRGLSSAAMTVDPGGDEDATVRLPAGVTPAQTMPAGTRFGAYELLEKIAQGGMGVVYRARHATLDRIVALKMILAGRFANAAEVQRFRHEAEAAARLDHSNIVPIYEIGEHEDRQYFTMKYVEGASLDRLISRFRGDPHTAARMLAIAARAVHHGHRRGVLHRDLKPANILIDEAGEPHVTDFGVAKRIEDDAHLTRTGTVIGTPAYMAPEQAAGLVTEVTTATDVYSLGTILYEVLTGRPPFDAESAAQMLRVVIEQQPAPPRQIDPSIDRDLETICLKCLEKDRKQRYQTALELAEELTRFCNGELIRARPLGRAARAWRWARRHPALTGFAAATFALICAVALGALSLARQRERQLIHEARASSVWSARTAAISFLWQLDRFSRTVVRLADDPQLAQNLASADHSATRRWLSDVAERHGRDEGFESWFLQDGVGVAIGRWPHLEALVGRDFSARDYYQGAARHAGASSGHGIPTPVHVSRVFKSEADGLYKFAISAPVSVADGAGGVRLVGVVTATISTDSTMGSLRLNDERREAALAGRIDPSSAGAGAAAPFRILVHPAYHRRDEAVELHTPLLADLPPPRPNEPELQLSADAPAPPAAPAHAHGTLGRDASRLSVPALTDDAYIDPLGSRDARYAGRWLAAFAPVGNTELVVIVQQRYDEVITPDKTLVRNLALAIGAAASAGLLFAAAIAWHGMRRGRA